VSQRIRWWVEQGKATQEQLNEVDDMFDEVLDGKGMPDEEDAIAEIVPILKRRMHDTAVELAIEAIGHQRDFSQVSKLIDKSERLGKANTSIGVGLESAFEEISTIRQLPRLRCGIPELDGALEGGPELGTSFIYLGSSGDGKSVMLVQSAAEALIQGYNVAYATLEISVPRTFARLIANITGVPINGILNGSRHLAEERYEKINRWLDNRDRPLGMFRIEEFPANDTTIADIKAWVERIEKETGKKIHVVVIDYLDRCTLAKSKLQKDSYTNMLLVYEDFRRWMDDPDSKDIKRWGLSASQAVRRNSGQRKTKPNRKGSGPKLLDIDDGADSQNKVRVTDGMVTLNVSFDGKEITFFIGKNRHGNARAQVGPLPTAWACGRIAPPNRPWDLDFEEDDDDDDDDDFEQESLALN